VSLRRICLVGVRGVGKTTLLRQVLPDFPAHEHIVGSQVLRLLAGPEFSRFDHLPDEVKESYRHQAIRWMEDHQAESSRHVLCDGHTTLVGQGGEVEQVFTERDCRFFRELILLEAPAEVVYRRRQADLKPRAPRTVEQIQEELDGERACCVRLAQTWDMRLHRLPSDQPEAALREVLR